MFRCTLTLGLGMGLLWSGTAMALVVEREERQHGFAQPMAQGTTAAPLEQGGPIEDRGLPLPQPGPNLQQDSQVLDQAAQQAQREAIAGVIRQAQDYALINDGYVGSPNYIYSSGGEQIGLDELNLSGWGGFDPYTLGF
ncbi:hypothetical protein RYO59_000487 [Thermosynechococcaceae cyanobacterium Okahandja]